MQLSGKIEPTNQYKGKKGNFVKTFLINDELNKNLWLANNKSHLKNLDRWIGVPGLEYFNEKGERDHPPESKTYDEAIEKQKPYIKAEIVDIGYDEQTGNFWEMSIVYNDKLYQDILDGVVKFVSPSIMRTKGKEVGPVRIADDYIPVHYAYVDNPAYDDQAKVVGTCSRCTIAEAKIKLDPLIASLKDTPLPNTSFNEQLHCNNQMDNSELEKQLKAANDENDKNKKTVDELKAELDDIKKKNQESANEDIKNKTESANDDNDKKNQESANDESEEDKKNKQESAAIVEEIKIEKINTILQASKAQGVDTKTLDEYRNFLKGSSIKEINGFTKIVNSSVPSYPTQESASNKFPNMDEVVTSDLMEQFSASTTQEDHSTKLQELGVMN